MQENFRGLNKEQLIEEFYFRKDLLEKTGMDREEREAIHMDMLKILKCCAKYKFVKIKGRK